MKLSEILSAERVVADLSVTSKKKALEELANLLSKGAATLTPAEAFTSLIARERLGGTGLGGGVAIPHGRVGGIEESVAAFVRLKQPVDYEAHDNRAVDLLFGLLVPKAASDDHLKYLAAAAEMFSDAELCARLRAAPDDKALYALVVGYPAST